MRSGSKAHSPGLRILAYTICIPLALTLAACSGDPAPESPTKGDLLREKLEICASEWSDDGSDLGALVSASDPAALVTTTTDGECLIVFAGDPNSPFSGQTFERGRSGDWFPFVSPTDPGELEARVIVSRQLDSERAETPNAFVVNPVSPGGIYEHPQVSLDPEAPLPTTARLLPRLIANPPQRACDQEVAYSESDLPEEWIDPFVVDVVWAKGISCREVTELVETDFPFLVDNEAGPWIEKMKAAFIYEFLERLDSVDPWYCEGSRRLVCEQGTEVSFELFGRPQGTTDVGGISATKCPGIIDLGFGWGKGVPKEGFGDIQVEGVDCTEAIDVLIDWAKGVGGGDSEGWRCIENGSGNTAQPVKCQTGSESISFGYFGSLTHPDAQTSLENSPSGLQLKVSPGSSVSPELLK